MKIFTIIEDHPNVDKSIKYEHGISCMFNVDGVEYLFDTGLTGLFLENFPKLNKNPNDIQKIIISHGHNDHAGGLMKLLKNISNKPEIYLGSGFFNTKYKILSNGDKEYKSCGFSSSDLCKYKVNNINDKVTKLSENMYLFSNFSCTNTFETIPEKYVIEKDGVLVPDKFEEEISVGIKTPKGLVLIVGCSHIGVVNIIESAKKYSGMNIRGVIGGTHLINCSQVRLDKTIEYLKEQNLDFLAVSHCTGDENMGVLKENFKEKFILNNSGNIIEI